MGGGYSKCTKKNPCITLSKTLKPVKTVYVDAERGSDSNSGKCYKQAFKTLDRAIHKNRCYKSVKFAVAEGDYLVTKSFDSSNYWFEGSLQEFGKVSIERVANEIGIYLYKIVGENLPGNVSIELGDCLKKGFLNCLQSGIKNDNTFAWPEELDVNKKYRLYQHNTNIKLQATYTNNSVLFSNCFVEHGAIQSNNNTVSCENAILAHNQAVVANGAVYLNRSVLFASEFEYQAVEVQANTFAIEGTIVICNNTYQGTLGLAREVRIKNNIVNLENHITEGNDQFTNCRVSTKNIQFAFATYTACDHIAEEIFVGAGLLGSSSGCGFGNCKTSCRLGRCEKSGQSVTIIDTNSTPNTKTITSIQTAKCKDIAGDSTAILSSVTKYARDVLGIWGIIDEPNNPSISCEIDNSLVTKVRPVCQDNLKQDELVRYTLTAQSSKYYFAESARVTLRSTFGKLLFNNNSKIHFEFNSRSTLEVMEDNYPIDMIFGRISGCTLITLEGAQSTVKYFTLESGASVSLDVASYANVPNGPEAINFLENSLLTPVPGSQQTTQNTVPNAQNYQFAVNRAETLEVTLIPTGN